VTAAQHGAKHVHGHGPPPDVEIDVSDVAVVVERTAGTVEQRTELAEGSDPLGRSPMQPLEVFGQVPSVEKGEISAYGFSALYQQNPVPDDGSYFMKEHFRRAVVPPLKRCNVYIAWDFAISTKQQSSRAT
jgi:hypothetical protein